LNWDNIEDNWSQLTVAAKENWSKFTDQDLEQISGKREPLISKIQESYGVTRREADKQVWDWGKSVGRPAKKSAAESSPLRRSALDLPPSLVQG
jgi:uncharacterized protein YjbJ (UPF0337 family)